MERFSFVGLVSVETIQDGAKGCIDGGVDLEICRNVDGMSGAVAGAVAGVDGVDKEIV